MDIFTKYNYIYNFIAQYFQFINEPETIEEYSSSESDTDTDYDSDNYIDQ